MSSLSRNNPVDEMDSRGLCISDRIAEAFEYYQVPPNLGQEVIDPLDEHTLHSCQSCYLGLAYLKFDVLPASQVHFYKVTRSEISEPTYDIKMKRHLYCPPIQRANDSTDLHVTDRACNLTSPEGSEAFLPLSETPHTSLPLMMSQDESNLITSAVPAVSPTAPGNTIGTTIALPPKKRKKRRIVRHSVIFTLAKECDPHYDLSSLPTDVGAFYVFPQNALIDVTNDMAPFEIFCTFYSSKLQSSPTFSNISSSPSSHIQYRTKLEQLAAICDSSNRLVSTTPNTSSIQKLEISSSVDSEYHQSINVEIYGASGDIYHSLKETVSDYLVLCQKMAKLLNVHNQHLNTYKNEFTFHPEQHSASTPSTISMEKPAHHPKTDEKIDTTQLPHRQHQQINDGDQQYDIDHHQNEPIIQNHSHSTIKRQYTKKKHGQQNDNKIAKRSYNKKKHNQTGDSAAHGAIKADSGVKVKDHTDPPTKKKTKRLSVNRDKEDSNLTNTRQCLYCGVTETPMWRRGPDGGGTLCNACGVKWKNGKILLSGDGTKLNDSKRKLSTSDIITMKEKRIKTIVDYNLDTTTTGDLIITENGPKNSRLHEYADASTTHLPLYNTSSSDDIDMMDDSLTMNTTTTKFITPTTAMASDDNSLSSSTTTLSSSSSSSSSSSNELICNSPPPPLVASFTSSTNVSPPIPMDIQKHSMAFTGKLDYEGGTMSLTPGADDVEAAALLTLLSQS